MSSEEAAIYQKLLDNSYKQFLDDIEDARGMDRAKLEELAQGLVYTGDLALEAGLIDHIGSLEDAKVVVKSVLVEKYKIEKVDGIKFINTWQRVGDLSSIDKFLGIDLSISQFVPSLLGSKSQHTIQSHDFQPLWLLK